MVRIKGSLVFRLWLPFVVMIMLFSSVAAIYYTNKQRKVIIEKYNEALEKIGMTVALGVELSLSTEDFNGMARTFDFVRSERTYDYIIIFTTDSLSRQKEILSVFPDTLKVTPTLSDQQVYIFNDIPFSSKTVNGFVRVGVRAEQVEYELEQLNRPVYFALLLTLLLMVAIIFYIVKIVTKPILTLANTIRSSNVTDEEFNGIKKLAYGEIRLLTERFQLMMMNLRKEEENNNRILKNLDGLVHERTLELEKAKQRLTRAQETAGLCSFEYDCNRDLLIFSEPVSVIFDFAAVLPLESFLNLVNKEKATILHSYFKDAPAGTVFDDVFIIKSEEGQRKELWVHLICSKSANAEKGIVINGTIQNITTQKQAEAEILRLSLVAELTSNSVLITDASKKIIWANASFLKLTGYSMDELTGKSPRIFQYEKTDPAAIIHINEQLAAHEVVRNLEIQNRGKYGNEYWLELNIVPIVADGIVTGYIGVEVDITDRKKMEDELISLNRGLESKVIENTQKYLELTQAYNEQEKLAAVGEVTAGIAHDLNTPISTILIGSESLQDLINEILGKNIFELTADEIVTAYQLATNVTLEIFLSGTRFEIEKQQVFEYLLLQPSVAIDEADSLAEQLVRCRIHTPAQIQSLLHKPHLKTILLLTEKIQTVLRLSNTIRNSAVKSATVVQNVREHLRMTDHLEKQPVNLYQSISSSLNIFNYAIGQRVRIETDISTAIFISGSEIKLFQLWSNLIKNAIEAMSSVAKPVLKIKALIDSNHVKVCFENNGPVIPDSSLQTIFSRFYSTKSSMNGTGLGLTIVQNVIKEHDGQINVTSDAEATVFTVIFKLYNPHLNHEPLAT
jgi:PAS domain S-box-containing protein